MKSNLKFLKLLKLQVLLSSSLLLANSALGVVVSGTPASLYDLLPRDTQGTNDIRLQQRLPGTSTYTDLTHGGDYVWHSPANHYNLPFVIRSAGTILAEPYALVAGGAAADPVIRVQVDGPFRCVRVQGSAGLTGGNVLFYVYKGATNWASPLWQGAAGSFDFQVLCSPGEELFFAVSALGDDRGDHSFWQDLQLTGIGFAVSETPAALYDFFPRNAQGTNGVYLQRRTAGTGAYTDLSYGGDFTWNAPEHASRYNLPFVIRDAGIAGKILAEPYAPAVGTPEDPVIRVQLNPVYARIRVQGATVSTMTPILYYIYKGAGNWANPLWQSGGADAFDFQVVCNPGEELFFAVNAAGSDASDHGAWHNVTLTSLPVPVAAYHAIELGWPSATNAAYQVQYRTNLESAVWFNLSPNIPGNGATNYYFDTCRSNEYRFYRVIETATQ